MNVKMRCPNPKGCDGELYARADEVSTLWCPKCGFVFPPADERSEPRRERQSETTGSE